MEILVGVLAVAVVALAGLLFVALRRDSSKGLEDRLKLEFQSLTQAALRESREELERELSRHSSAGSQELEGKKALIDQQLYSIKSELVRVTDLVRGIEKDREAKFGQLAEQIRNVGEQATALTASTNTLGAALANSRARGQWGERMAEDIFRLMGLREGVNYRKQETIGANGSRPDFTFLLPRGETLNMDVKFPLDNYVRFLESEEDSDRSAFLRDVRQKVKEVSSRGYIDTSQGTLDYVLLFIPNESVYSFIHENDPSLLDDALKSKVIWCSPSTLYCVLAVVRQAVDNFAMEQTSNEIISLMGAFNEQWQRYQQSVVTLGNRLESTQKAFEDVRGTRKRMLERPLGKIEELRQQRRLPVEALEETDEGLSPPS